MIAKGKIMIKKMITGKSTTTNGKKEKKAYPYSHYDPNIKIDEIIRLNKITFLNYDSVKSAVANEIPTFLRWMEQIRHIILRQKAVSDKRTMLWIDKDSEQELGRVILSIIRQFSPDILYFATVYYPDDLDDENSTNYRLIEHKLYEKELNYASVGRIYNNIAVLQVIRNDYESAIEFYNISIDYKKSSKDFIGVALTYRNIAVLYESEEDLNNAYSAMKQCVKIAEKNKDPKLPDYVDYMRFIKIRIDGD